MTTSTQQVNDLEQDRGSKEGIPGNFVETIINLSFPQNVTDGNEHSFPQHFPQTQQFLNHSQGKSNEKSRFMH